MQKTYEFTDRGAEKFVKTLLYYAYAQCRDTGLSHEAIVKAGLGNDNFKLMYETEIDHFGN